MRIVPPAPLSGCLVAAVHPHPGAPPPGPSPLTSPENWHQLSGKPLSWPKETASLLPFPPAARLWGQWAVGEGPHGQGPRHPPSTLSQALSLLPRWAAQSQGGGRLRRVQGTLKRQGPALAPTTHHTPSLARRGSVWGNVGSPPAPSECWLPLPLAGWSQAPAFSESVSLPIRGRGSTDRTSHPSPTPSLTRDGRPAPGGEVGGVGGGRPARTRRSCSRRGGVSHREEHPVYQRGAKQPGRPPEEAGKGKKGGQERCDGVKPSCLPIFKMSGHLHLLIRCIPSHILSIREKETSKILASSGGAKHPDRDQVDAGIQTNDSGPKGSQNTGAEGSQSRQASRKRWPQRQGGSGPRETLREQWGQRACHPPPTR